MLKVKSMLVRDFMQPVVLRLSARQDIRNAIHLLQQHQLSGAVVVDGNGRLCGLLTERDCMKAAIRAAYHDEPGGVVGDYMATEVITLTPTESIADVARRFFSERYLRYPVTEDGQLVGVISRSDVMRAIDQYWQL